MADTATWYLASGAALVVAMGSAAWRVPVLFLIAVQYALHSLNHLLDISEAHTSWLGPANFISLALATVVLVFMLREAAR